MGENFLNCCGTSSFSRTLWSESVGEFVDSDCSTSLHPSSHSSFPCLPLLYSPPCCNRTALPSPPCSLDISAREMPSGDERHISLADTNYVIRARDQKQTQHFWTWTIINKLERLAICEYLHITIHVVSHTSSTVRCTSCVYFGTRWIRPTTFTRTSQ